MVSVGWTFTALMPSGDEVAINPYVGAQVSHDQDRDVRRDIKNVTFLPVDIRRLGILSVPTIRLDLVVDGVTSPLGLFKFIESTLRTDIVIDPETRATSDITVTGLGDLMVSLKRADGSAETILPGADPSQEMIRILENIGFPCSIAGSTSPTAEPITWGGSVTTYEKITTLADLAGHRPSWVDNNGVLRSISAQILDFEIIELDSFLLGVARPMITESYLSAPNRVIVTESSSSIGAISGIWDAPASAPHSEANRGFVLARSVTKQGLKDNAHAQQVAESLGESFSGRKLAFSLAYPTHLLDGPVVISYRDALWQVNSWGMNTAPNSQMTVDCTELVL